MTIEWIRGNIVTDITEVVSSVSWSGSVSQAARTAEVTLLNAPDDENIEKLALTIGAGDLIRLTEDGTEVFYGQVHIGGKLSQNGTITYSCIDMLEHLLRSTGVYNFENTTPEDITKRVCADLEIPTGNIYATNAPINKMIIDGSAFYDIIMMAYTKASRQTGDLYICRMQGASLSVSIKGVLVQSIVLAEEYNLTNTTYQETTENMVNVVKIYDDTGKQIGEIRDEDGINKYGIFQQIYKKEDGINETTAATNMLVGVEKKVTLDAIEGNIECIAGNAVEVWDKATGLNGIFWIDTDTHTWENGIHTMNLELNFKNLMDERE